MRERVHSIQRRQPPCVHVRAVDEGHANGGIGGGGGGECCKRKAQARSHHIPTSPLHSTSPHKHQRMLHTHTHTHSHMWRRRSSSSSITSACVSNQPGAAVSGAASDTARCCFAWPTGEWTARAVTCHERRFCAWRPMLRWFSRTRCLPNQSGGGAGRAYATRDC